MQGVTSSWAEVDSFLRSIIELGTEARIDEDERSTAEGPDVSQSWGPAVPQLRGGSVLVRSMWRDVVEEGGHGERLPPPLVA